jgi:membrane-associated phospholipid phosphatase
MSVQLLKPHLLAVTSLLTIPLLGIVYVYLNHSTGTVYSLVTDLDRQMPFLKVFVLPYVSWYVFLFIAFLYLAIKNREAYYQTLLQFNIGLLICYAVYAVYQTHVPRPELVGDGWLLQIVQWVYNSDEPFNCFPSIHVLTSYLMMKAYLGTANVPRIYTVAVVFMSMLIIASTQFIKQHVLLDIMGAVLVAEGVIYVVSFILKGWMGKSLVTHARQKSLEGSFRR